MQLLVAEIEEQNKKYEVSLPDMKEVEQFAVKAKEALLNLGFEKKQAIVRKLVDQIVASQQEMTVYGHLPIGKENEYVGFKSISWDIHHTIPSLEFHFTFAIPKPRKERIITQRDEWGRIISSRILN